MSKWKAPVLRRANQNREPVEARLARHMRLAPETGCLEWTGATVWNGYGRFRAVVHDRQEYRAHRVAYALSLGPIPAASPSAANRAKTHCKHGHELTAENTLSRPDKRGGRQRTCRTCAAEAQKRYRASTAGRGESNDIPPDSPHLQDNANG